MGWMLAALVAVQRLVAGQMATGKPETMIARAFHGTIDRHMAQYAWRSTPDAAEFAAETAWLATVRLASA